MTLTESLVGTINSCNYVIKLYPIEKKFEYKDIYICQISKRASYISI